ncbi:Ribonuclease H-like superfamily [Sesbania bispinosa]|nr:Ribonuclease H-like superfamily [Sesbania bispinosa]
MDFIGPITPASKQRSGFWLLQNTTQGWVEAVAVKGAKADETVVTFIKENIVCRFGLPKRIVSDNGTHFVNAKVKKVLDKYGIQHDRSSPYYPQSNGQAESTNKNLLHILSRMHYGRTGPHSMASTKTTPFSLVYGAEAILPVEVLVPSARMILGDLVPREASAELVEEDREKAGEELMRHHRRLSLAYEKLVKPRMFHEGELVLKATDVVMRKQHTSKWAPNWEGPYVIKKHMLADIARC